MNIEYRKINPVSFEEVRYFLITHEYSWRDSDPEGFLPKSEEKRDKSAQKLMEDLIDPVEKYHALGAFMNSNVRVSNESMIALNKKMGYTIERYNFRKNL